ncbi:serine hydrolase [Oceanihabitans sp. 2_MG-2023]|uniref:serine hydrolase n=1 Tax=Oceanihabitans sp. 2_MG-2023 TaxID=3062661 RepID=UPI0026E1B5AE|nr:serine hydrolase [Oceanihabitans sp. 2_MG-2023]MDO6597341.1 serine hydrolase [Oceanihabitans sp. 2_MG-2023]
MKQHFTFYFSKTKAILFFALLFFAHFTFGQVKEAQLTKLINTYTDYKAFNGSVLVAQEGKIIYKKGFGFANMEWDIPNAANTKHRLGSISKQFTGMLILQLAEAGKLDLQAPITKYLPEYPKATGDIITTHHLLTHSSGIPNYTSFPDFFKNESRNPYTPLEFISKFSEKELEFTPGERFSYSNSGYFLLGVLIEKISGKTYEKMLQEKIFTPLKMNDSGFDHHATILKNRATGYEKQGGDFINSSYLDMSIPYAAGSLYATAEDLYLWDQALYTNTLLSKASMDLFFGNHIKAGNEHYGYGWFIGSETIGDSKESIETISHGGGINGFNTLISRAPSDQSLIVLLNNTGGAPLGDMAKAIRGIIYDKPYSFPKKSVANIIYEEITANGMDTALKQYNIIKSSEDYDLNEKDMNSIGYRLLQAEKVDDAITIFKLNVDAFPNSFNVYDSYAEALMTKGNKEQAIVNYKKSVELNPNNQNGITQLKKLGVDVTDLEKEVVVAEEILESYVGTYQLMPEFSIKIIKEGNQLKAQATGQPAADIFAKSETVFYLKVVTAQLTFNKNEAGEVESVTLLQGGREITGKKM